MYVHLKHYSNQDGIIILYISIIFYNFFPIKCYKMFKEENQKVLLQRDDNSKNSVDTSDQSSGEFVNDTSMTEVWGR